MLLDPTKMTKAQKQGYVSWANQRSKCNNPKNPDFKYYGAKGIRVEYSSRQFVLWWLKNLKRRKWTQPTVGRIDHDRNYSFDNIVMQERIENSSERCRRLGRPVPAKTAPKFTAVFKNGRKIKKFRSAMDAAVYFKLNTSTVVRLCQGKYISGGKRKTKLNNGLYFKYEGKS